MKKSWYALTSKEIFHALKTSSSGLSAIEAHHRLERFGKNSLPEKEQFSALDIFLSQFQNALIYVLGIAGAISFLLQKFLDTLVIFVTLLINVSIGYFQEFKAQNTLHQLKKVISLNAFVVREGKELLVHAEDVVPGDVIVLKTGERVPADARLLEAKNLQVDEANLTGESFPVEKHTRVLTKKQISLPDMVNMVFSGTMIVAGHGMAVVCATGLETEIGNVASLVAQTLSTKTPLQLQLRVLSHRLAFFTLFFVALIFALGIASGKPFLEMFLVAVAVSIAMVPEGLVLAVTVVLASGMQRILGKNGLVRRLVSAETLGSTTVICTDKTGTLTEGKMRVVHVVTANKDQAVSSSYTFPLHDAEFSLIATIALSGNDVVVTPSFNEDVSEELSGSPTEKALFLFAREAGLKRDVLLKEQKCLDTLPFDSKRKYRVSLHSLNVRQNILYIVGAMETLIDHASYLFKNGKHMVLSSGMKKMFLLKQEHLNAKGLRTIGVACKIVSSKMNTLPVGDEDIVLRGSIFVGFIGLSDILRSHVKEALQQASAAGIRTVMLTGDNKVTARTVAQDLGLMIGKDVVCDATELSIMTDENLQKRLPSIRVFARVSPQDKLRIVDAYQHQGEVVAMTGDGVNDAPALKKADIGVAMGDGSEVTKSTADLVLLDNNFQTIVSAVEEGRTIFENIRKVVLYLLSDGFTEVALIGGAVVLGMPLPLTAAQILWVNLIEEGFPAFALAVESSEQKLMREKPRRRYTTLFDRPLRRMIAIIAMVNSLLLFSLYAVLLQLTGDVDYANAMVFAGLGMDSLFIVFSCRSLRSPLWKHPLSSNPSIFLAVGLGILGMLAALYLPFLQKMLHTQALGIAEWALILTMIFLQISTVEFLKALYNKKRKKDDIAYAVEVI